MAVAVVVAVVADLGRGNAGAGAPFVHETVAVVVLAVAAGLGGRRGAGDASGAGHAGVDGAGAGAHAAGDVAAHGHGDLAPAGASPAAGAAHHVRAARAAGNAAGVVGGLAVQLVHQPVAVVVDVVAGLRRGRAWEGVADDGARHAHRVTGADAGSDAAGLAARAHRAGAGHGVGARVGDGRVAAVAGPAAVAAGHAERGARAARVAAGLGRRLGVQIVDQTVAVVVAVVAGLGARDASVRDRARVGRDDRVGDDGVRAGVGGDRARALAGSGRGADPEEVLARAGAKGHAGAAVPLEERARGFYEGAGVGVAVDRHVGVGAVGVGGGVASDGLQHGAASDTGQRNQGNQEGGAQVAHVVISLKAVVQRGLTRCYVVEA